MLWLGCRYFLFDYAERYRYGHRCSPEKEDVSVVSGKRTARSENVLKTSMSGKRDRSLTGKTVWLQHYAL